MQKLAKIRLSAAELLRIFDFQNGGHGFGMTRDLCLMVLTSS